MKSSNIIIVSNIKDTAQQIMSKIVLLRSEDSVSGCFYGDILNYLSLNTADLIIVHAQKIQDTEIIPKIKAAVKNTNIILAVESEDTDLICRAFDGGIDDYVNIRTPDVLFSIRVMCALKRKCLSDSYDKKSDILSIVKILDKKTQFYREEYTNKIFVRAYNSVLKSNDTKSYMLMIKTDLTYSGLAGCVKKVMRNSDIAGFSSDETIYVIIHNTSKGGVQKFFSRLKYEVGKAHSVFGSAINIKDKTYANSVKILKKLLERACNNPNTLLIGNVNALKQEDKEVSGYEAVKLSENSPVKKLDKIINSVFLKMFSVYEPKFPDSKIIWSVGKNKSTFTFKSNLCYAQLSLSYEKQEKVSVEIDCIFHGKEKVEICEINSDDLSSELIGKLIREVALRYKQALDGKE